MRFADGFWLDDLRRAVCRDLFDATWEAWDEARHRKHLAACYQRGHLELLVLAGEPIGVLQVELRPRELELVELQNHPEHPSHRRGSRVIRELLEEARRDGLGVLLGTGLYKLGAQQLDLRLGFRETSRSATHLHLEWRPPEAPPLA